MSPWAWIICIHVRGPIYKTTSTTRDARQLLGNQITLQKSATASSVFTPECIRAYISKVNLVRESHKVTLSHPSHLPPLQTDLCHTCLHQRISQKDTWSVLLQTMLRQSTYAQVILRFTPRYYHLKRSSFSSLFFYNRCRFPIKALLLFKIKWDFSKSVC